LKEEQLLEVSRKIMHAKIEDRLEDIEDISISL
jgi:hypothetical protein